MIISDFQDKETFIKSLRNHGANPKYFHSYIGYNSRLDTMQAAILSVKLKYLAQWTDGRRMNAEFYNQSFIDIPLVTPIEKDYNYHIYNQYTIASENRDKFIEYLGRNEISNVIYYPVPLHAQNCYKYLGYSADDFPVAEKLARQVVSIPIFPDLTSEEKEYVAETISRFFE